MKVKLDAKVSEELLSRVRERAVVEQRSLSNMIERLLSLGLGTVVEPSFGGVAKSIIEDEQRKYGIPIPGVDIHKIEVERDLAECGRSYMHRSGEYCKACGRVPK